ncbi:MAG: GNAT family N-acetyltransferase [Ktedonobacterales bacterium]
MPATITRRSPDSADALLLIRELETHLESLYPRESRHGLSVEQLLMEDVPFFVLCADDGTPGGCAGVKLFGTEYAEVKRMYVRPQFRGYGFAKALLQHIETYTREHGIDCLRLETGIYQTEAIGLYERLGFRRIPPFGSYTDDPLSLCYEKSLA